MATGRSSKKKAVTVRLDYDLVTRYQEFIRYHAGHPLYLSHASFITAAIERHMHELTQDATGERHGTKDNNTLKQKR